METACLGSEAMEGVVKLARQVGIGIWYFGSRRQLTVLSAVLV